ncbi:MAG: type VI secretion system baseplate subunit TssK [Acidobacteria bacterium]|nr:type VI secretion system baseplate subunit TssK [Acidobacteriota bacterium]
MKYLSRVVWSEGMYLAPHHFQVQSRYFEDMAAFAISSLWFEPYGLAGCGLDHEALHNGTVSLLHARGMFADGLPFHMPESDPLPEPRNIAELFPPTRDTLTVELAIPQRRQNGLNCVPEEGANGTPARFVAQRVVLHDETTGVDEREVRLGRKNIRLLLDTEVGEGELALPVARVMRDFSGHFIYDPSFIPPCVQIGASDRLMTLLQRLVEILEEKSNTLGQGRRSGAKSWAEYSTRDVANFWLLHTVNSALAPLRHLFLSKRGHPEELYVEMARLGGALCTFALDSHPSSLPLYDHRNLDHCFGTLDEHIRRHLETIVPTNCINIPLVKTADYFYEAEVTDQRCFSPSRWIFSIRSPAGEVEVISKTPQLVKICSKLFVPELVKRALPGMGMTHLPVPPSAVSARLDTQYFGISTTGPCWDHLVKTRQLGVYVPGELPEPELELLVILQS